MHASDYHKKPLLSTSVFEVYEMSPNFNLTKGLNVRILSHERRTDERLKSHAKEIAR